MVLSFRGDSKEQGPVWRNFVGATVDGEADICQQFILTKGVRWIMKFLVTGGLGFIGQRVVRSLLGRGIPTVSADDSPNAEAIAGLHAAAGSAAEFDAVTMDVSDFRDVMAVFQKHPEVSHAIHLAYVMDRSWTRILRCLRASMYSE